MPQHIYRFRPTDEVIRQTPDKLYYGLQHLIVKLVKYCTGLSALTQVKYLGATFNLQDMNYCDIKNGAATLWILTIITHPPSPCNICTLSGHLRSTLTVKHQPIGPFYPNIAQGRCKAKVVLLYSPKISPQKNKPVVFCATKKPAHKRPALQINDIKNLSYMHNDLDPSVIGLAAFAGIGCYGSCLTATDGLDLV